MQTQPDRRRLLGMLALGLASLLATYDSGRVTTASGTALPPSPTSTAPSSLSPSSTALPPVPPPRPGPSQVLSHGPTTNHRIVLTVDDGTSADVVAGYVAFATRTGIHLTFSPNGVNNREWAPHAPELRPLIADGQVQIINHTFTHRDLRTLTPAQIRDELQRNDDWVIHTFGITTRPYYRPPYGRHSPAIDNTAAAIGYTRTVMWNGSFSDSTVITPAFLLTEAQKYLQPGVINLGHANHPAVLSVFDQLIDLIHGRGLQPVTLDEMFSTSRATGTG
ncbi:MAG TPA: polysaccharide deacetylase family protein [Pseudonocardia sp.]